MLKVLSSDSEVMTTIEVPWVSQTNTWWNDTTAQVVKHFGLPGDKYRTEVSVNYMKFHFIDEQDAFMCRLLLSEKL
jgi:hypothetical protein